MFHKYYLIAVVRSSLNLKYFLRLYNKSYCIQTFSNILLQQIIKIIKRLINYCDISLTFQCVIYILRKLQVLQCELQYYRWTKMD